MATFGGNVIAFRPRKSAAVDCSRRFDYSPTATRRSTCDDVYYLFGNVEPYYVSEILAQCPTFELLEETHSWLVRQGDIMGQRGRTKAKGIAAILEYVVYGDDPVAGGNVSRS